MAAGTSAQDTTVGESVSPVAGETLVTASRAEQDPFEAPFTSEAITDARIREQAYRTTPQVLRDVPGVMVQETAHGQGSPYIRGFTGFRNVLLIDGIRLNHSAMRDGPNQYWNTLDPLAVERFEVVKGPASVAWGSDAIGGAVQALTKTPSGITTGRLGGELYYRVASAEESHIAHLDLAGFLTEDTGLWLGGSLKHFGDVRAGDGTGNQPSTGYDEWGLDVKLEHWLSDREWVVLAYDRVEQTDVPRTHRTTDAKSFEGTTVGTDLRRDLDQERELVYAQLHAEDLGGILDEYHVSLSWHRHEEDRDRIRGSGSRSMQGFDLDTFGFFAHATTEQTPIGRLTFGLDWYHDEVDSYSTSNPVQGPIADDSTYDMIGLFAEDEIAVSEDLTVTLGTRFQYVDVEADEVLDPATSGSTSIDDDWSSLIGSARFLYRFEDDVLHAFGGISQGFRAPNLSDLTRFDSARTDEFEVPSPGLDPEYFLQYELGLRRRGPVFSGEVSVFYTDIRDQIVRVPTGDVTPDGDFVITKENAGDGYAYGVEAGVGLQVDPHWNVFGTIAYLEGKVDTFPTSAPVKEEEYLDRLMPLNGRIGARWTDLEDRAWFETTLDLAADADKLSTRDEGDTSRIPPGGTPGYAVFSLRGGWRVSQRCRVEVALENLFDEDYRIHGSGLNQPGRNLILGLTFGL